MIDTIDILITSTSRPSLLRQTVASMQDRIKFSGKLRWLLHEDCLDEIKSAELIHWAGYSTIFDHISVSRPRIGLGQSIHSMFEHIKSPIFFRSDDDWEYVEDIYLDPLVAIFEKYNEINQIVFSKRCIDGQKRDFVRESYEYEKTWLTISNQWGWIPALWRLSFVKDKYKLAANNNISFFDELKSPNNHDLKWYRENMGSYFLGKIGDKGTFIKHTGGDARTLGNGGVFGIY